MRWPLSARDSERLSHCSRSHSWTETQHRWLRGKASRTLLGTMAVNETVRWLRLGNSIPQISYQLEKSVTIELQGPLASGLFPQGPRSLRPLWMWVRGQVSGGARCAGSPPLSSGGWELPSFWPGEPGAWPGPPSAASLAASRPLGVVTATAGASQRRLLQ